MEKHAKMRGKTEGTAIKIMKMTSMTSMTNMTNTSIQNAKNPNENSPKSVSVNANAKANTDAEKTRLELFDRRILNLNGVKNVVSFYDESVVLELSDGVTLNIDGENLNITALNLESGEVCIEGFVGGINYSDSQNSAKGRSLFSRLFG